MNLSAASIISLVLDAYLLIVALASMITGKVYGMQGSKYTDESLAKFARPYGALTLLVVIGLVISELYTTNMTDSLSLMFAGLAIAVAAGIAIAVYSKKVLVKK